VTEGTSMRRIVIKNVQDFISGRIASGSKKVNLTGKNNSMKTKN
jgi:hypothetical protein